MVFGDNPDNQLEPYDEGLVVPKYEVGVVRESEKNDFLNYPDYVEDYEALQKTNFAPEFIFEILYSKHGESWNSNRWEINDEGVWTEYSTYNPKSKYDWYDLGGRWAGYLPVIDPHAENTTPVKNPEFESSNDTPSNHANSSIVGNVVWDEITAPYGFIINGEWKSRGDMGWFGMDITGMPDEEWEKLFKDTIKSLPSDMPVYVYDFHI